MAFKSGFISVVGKPNVGKSTLINVLTGDKVSITSPKPQTTRNKVLGIVTEKSYQAVFIDTPGIHNPKTKLGEFMVKTAEDSMTGTDIILYLYDSQDTVVSSQDKAIIDQVKASGCKHKMLILTKVDLIQKETLLALISELSKLAEWDEIIPVSAKEKDGTKIIMKAIKTRLPEGPLYYPDDITTDSTVRDMAAEIIREKILLFTNEEVPHGTGVEIVSFIEPKYKGGVTTINANIYCEKESHKGILIGKDGAMLKRIGTAARTDIEKIEGSKVNLKLWVKLKEDWRNSASFIKELGYKEDK